MNCHEQKQYYACFLQTFYVAMEFAYMMVEYSLVTAVPFTLWLLTTVYVCTLWSTSLCVMHSPSVFHRWSIPVSKGLISGTTSSQLSLLNRALLAAR